MHILYRTGGYGLFTEQVAADYLQNMWLRILYNGCGFFTEQAGFLDIILRESLTLLLGWRWGNFHHKKKESPTPFFYATTTSF